MKFRSIKIWLMSVVALGLVGCESADPTAEVKMEMDSIKKELRGRIDPPPEFEEFEVYSYSATLLRSPFQEPIVYEDTPDEKMAIGSGETVEPDITRVKEALEFYGLDSLQMVGTIMKEDKILYALVSDGSGIHRVRKGNHMGRHFGEVISVKASKIEIVEIVSDGQGGWVKRPRTLVLKENG